MTVKDLLEIYENSVGTAFVIYDDDHSIYFYEHNDKKGVTKKFGHKEVEKFSFDNESTAELDIYVSDFV